MPAFGNTLNHLAIKKSRPYVEQVDNITENAPIVKQIPFNQATDNLWDVSSALTGINGNFQQQDLNAPLPELEISERLNRTELSVFGAELFVPEDTALLEGGPGAYFNNHRKAFERQTGMDVEKQYLYNAFLPFAMEGKRQGEETIIDAGGSADKNYTLMICRFDETFCGLFSPLCFKRDTFLDIQPINGGALYHQ